MNIGREMYPCTLLMCHIRYYDKRDPIWPNDSTDLRPYS